MKLVKCTNCGSNELIEESGLVVCVYCRSKYVPQAKDALQSKTVIGITSDIEALLQKCKQDPTNRRRYANLILDIDPTNQEAKNIIYRSWS